MNILEYWRLRRPRHASFRTAVALAVILTLVFTATVFAATKLSIDGFLDFGYPDSVIEPTESREEHKLWFNDDQWWASMYSTGASAYTIHRLDWNSQTWIDTDVLIDEREESRSDTLWDGNKLYIASYFKRENPSPVNDPENWGRLYRYSYNSSTDTYTLDFGFPLIGITQDKVKAISLEKDSTGRLWVAYVSRPTGTSTEYQVYISSSGANDTTWNPPVLLASFFANEAMGTSYDVANLIAFGDDGGDKLGIMWSNERSEVNKFFFATHLDSSAYNAGWVMDPVDIPYTANDHINLAKTSTGQMLAVIKTSAVTPGDALIAVIARDLDGSYSFHDLNPVESNDTKPIIVVYEPTTGSDKAYVFMSSNPTGGVICLIEADITTPLSSMSFPVDNCRKTGLTGARIVLGDDSTYTLINNATTTRQILNENTDIVLLATDQANDVYVHTATIDPPPSINIQKRTNGQDAQNPPGPFIPVGDTVTWTFRVTNTSDVDLTDINVTDDIEGVVTCDQTSLTPGQWTDCEVAGIATLGQYTNTATVSALPAEGGPITDSDTSYYFGVDPQIDIEKYTNGQDVDAAPGPYILAGDVVSWTYTVTNTGNYTLTNVGVVDDIEGPVDCQLTTLGPDESTDCEVTGTAITGQYTNTGYATGTPPVGENISASDTSYYFGSEEFVLYLPLVFCVDQLGPSLLVTGATADGDPMDGDLETGYILETTNEPAIDHLIQFAAGTDASEPLEDTHFGLYLVDSTVSAADLKDYYDDRGVPEPFLTYLKDAADGTNPFVYIKGTSVTLVDAAKYDLLSEEHDMTVPDDYPLGTYTVEGVIRDLAGNETTVTLILKVVDGLAPTLNITGATADGDAMDGDLETGYILETTNEPAIDHLIQFAAGTDASEPLEDTHFGLYLVDSTVSAADLKDYYDDRGVPEPFLTYLKDAADGTNPFVYIKGTSVTLVDAAKYDLLSEEHDMTVPDDYPLGTYTVEGVIRDLAGNETTVTLILKVVDGLAPTLNITGATADGDAMDGDLETGYILETTNEPAIDHLIQFAAGTDASEPLEDTHFGLYLVDSTVSAADLKDYYDDRGVPEPFLTYLKDAADGTNPFVYIKGTSVTLVDAAKYDLLSEEHDMTVPDDYPLGTYTVEGVIRDLAGNETTVTLILKVVDGLAPTLNITGATADGDAMDGDLETGYILETTNEPAIDHLIQFAAGTDASEPLEDTHFGLYLVDSTVSAADLKDYYDDRGVPEPFLTYLKDAADGTNPFVYIKGTSVTLVDAAKYDLLSEEHDMTVPDDYPLGTYTVEGVIRDLAGNETTVTLILVVSGDRE